MNTLCRFLNCENASHARGLCQTHYVQLKKAHWNEAALHPIGLKPTLLERWLAKVEVTVDGCWTWTGAGRTGRYGRFGFHGSLVQAHRAGYELFVGQIPEGLVLDHLCRNTFCVRPTHLEPVTEQENTLRGTSLQAVTVRTGICKRGHVIDDSNVYEHDGRRRCHACARERSAQTYRRHVEANREAS